MANYFWYYVAFTLVIMSFLMQEISAGTQVPCFFIFGDSYVDSGNNNNLSRNAKANYFPYGIDFHDGATGRFTNGKTITDYIGNYLGFNEFIPPYATAKGKTIIKGVNYGSGFAGIRDKTGYHLGEFASMSKQLSNHKTTRVHLSYLMGNQANADKHLKKCLYAVNIGSNDYVNNYFLPKFYNSSRRYKLDEYTNILTRKYFDQMKGLYDANARKVALFGLILLGCIPGELKKYGKNMECDKRINEAVQKFNQNLKKLVDELNQKLSGANFIFINTSGIFTDHHLRKGNSKEPCCKVQGKGLPLCIPEKAPCDNRNLYVYWDNLHLTETINQHIASISYNPHQTSYAYPKGIHQLVQNS